MEVRSRSTAASLIAVLLALAAQSSLLAEDKKSQTLKADPGRGPAQEQTAIDECKRALSLNPKAAEVWFRLAGIYLSQNKSQQALASYRSGLAVDPENISANKNYAQLLMQAGDFGAAVKPLQRITRSEPGDMQSQIALIEAYLKTGRPDDAAARIEELLKVSTSQDQLELTRILVRMKRMDRAQQVLEGLVKSNINLAEAHGQLGLLLMEKEQFQDAAWELGQAVNWNPNRRDIPWGSPKYCYDGTTIRRHSISLTECGHDLRLCLSFNTTLRMRIMACAILSRLLRSQRRC